MERGVVSLKTNFEDYYDDLLINTKSSKYVYYRRSNVLDKKLSLEYMRDFYGYFIPPIFKISEINKDNFEEGSKIVVFNKNYQETKSLNSAIKNDKNKYGRALIYGENSTSFYLYRIGSIFIKTKRSSDHKFRSDLGNTTEEIIDIYDSGNYEHNHIINCIEFAKISSVLFAINYNESPKLENTVIPTVLKPEEVYEQIFNWFKYKRSIYG